MQQQRFIDKSKLARHVSGNNFAPSSGALGCTLQLVVCCTQYVAGRWSGDGIPFMETAGSLSSQQQLATSFYAEPAESISF